MVHYSAAVKEEGITYQAIAERVGIRKAKRIKVWVRDYRTEGELGLHKVKGRPRKKEDQAAYIARLEMENALLKKFHEELRKLSKSKCATE
jgi:transposase